MKKEKNINIKQKEKEEKKKQAEKDKKIKKLKSKQTEKSKMIDLDVLEKPAEKNFGGMYLSDILKPVLFLVFAIVFEMVNFAFIRFKATGSSTTVQLLPTYFMINLSFYLVVAGIMFVVKRGWANAVMYVFLGFQIAINCINSTLYKVFGDIFSFDMIKLGGEAVAAFSFQFIEFWSILANLAILAVLITSQVLMDKKIKKYYPLKRMNRLSLLLSVFSALWTISITGFFVQTANFKNTPNSIAVAESDKYLWDNMQFKLEAYKKFGTYGFYAKSIGNLIYKNDKPTNAEITDIKKGLKDGQKQTNTSATLYGDNLIMIMLESFEWFAIDPIYTPTLWKIRTESGVAFENFYSKNKTNMSEDIGLNGNMPKDTQMSTLAGKDNLNTPYSLPNLFRSLGYSANYFHGYKKTFYERDVVNKNMGFENVYGVEDVTLENKSTVFNDWNLDSDYINAMLDKFIPDQDEPFFSFFTTVTTHGSYNRTNERFQVYYDLWKKELDKYKTWLSENTSYSYPEDPHMEALYRQYKCAAMDTDRMVKLVLDTLEARGLADKTTLVLYADHNAYYENLCYGIKNISKDDFYDTYMYNIPAMIWSKKLEHQVNNTFCNTYDIFPTVCELFGLPYNTYMTQGFNIFNPAEISQSLMVSYITGMFKQDIYSINIVDMYVTEGVTSQEMEFFKRDACRFYEKQHILEQIYKFGLFKDDK